MSQRALTVSARNSDGQAMATMTLTAMTVFAMKFTIMMFPFLIQLQIGSVYLACFRLHTRIRIDHEIKHSNNDSHIGHLGLVWRLLPR
jgi:hypothetical protein